MSDWNEDKMYSLSNMNNDESFSNKYTDQQVRVITLNSGQHLKSTLYRLEKGWILEFHLGPSLFGKDILLYCNHPPSNTLNFERKTFYLLEWLSKGAETGKEVFRDVSLYAQLTMNQAGSFHYYFSEKTEKSTKQLGSGYFTVSPVLSVGPNDKNMLLLDSIQCQTVLAKALGPFSEWENRLCVTKKSAYNMIHFTPVQELGNSNSSYCIKDQLKVNPKFADENIVPTYNDLSKIITKLKKEWHVLSICDVVLNHTANESSWILEHPECTYNMVTAPHLVPAAILDGFLFVFCNEISKGMFIDKGIPPEICTEEHLQAIKFYLETELLQKMCLEEYYICDIDKLGNQFKELIRGKKPTLEKYELDDLKLVNRFSGRKEATVDLELSFKIFNRESESAVNEESRVSECVEKFKMRLHEINSYEKNRINEHLIVAINNCIANIRYHRVEPEGPKIREITEKNPILPRYFTGEFSDYDSVEKVVLQRGMFVMAHNGWVMNFDPLQNFASSDSNVYIRRELIPWGDSVKLRYGDCYEDNPFLWDHMRRYVEKTAETFHGIRLDNCHSTPISVAEFLLDCARKVRPDLYVVAELFTNSDETDNIFINRLGISSLIREAMSAWNSHELGRLVYRYGGDPVGSFCASPVRPLVPSVAHALFFDVTHDNESPIQKKSVFDSLCSSALVSMACCASGSTRGFDELVPHNIDVVNEERLYTVWTDSDVVQPGRINCESGILSVKRRLNLLHKMLNDEGYTQIYVDQMDEDIVAVTRHNPVTHDGVILIAHTSYSYPQNNIKLQPHSKSLKIEGCFTEIILEATLEHTGERGRFVRPENFVQDKNYINGLLDYKVSLREFISIAESSMIKSVPSENPKISQYEFKNFSPGSIIIAKVFYTSEVQAKLEFIANLAKCFMKQKFGNLIDIITKLSLEDLNMVLYRCSEEDFEEGHGSYDVPGYGSLVYCGLQGFSSVLQDIRNNNDLGHPFCQNLRQGNWMLDYISSRLKRGTRTLSLGLWFEEIFGSLRELPRYLIPRYFDAIITPVTSALLSRAAIQMSEFVQEGSNFVRVLSMGSVQCVGVVKSAVLPPFSPLLHLPEPDVKNLTMCAGLPHFTTGYMRSWGRDTFISLRGLLLITGRYEVARCHILGYASCLRHGLIPNLLDCGINARFNCRDAVWWWLYSIASYVKMAPGGYMILHDPVSRIFPKDDSLPLGVGMVDQPLHYIMQEALLAHFQGLNYRERNAGDSLDQCMTDAGFDNSIGVDLDTGFIYGGNEYNCGTWMDKMGSSREAGNYGRPATPRDGSAVELVGLSKAVLRELIEMHGKGYYPFDSVERKSEDGKITKWTFKEWGDKIALNFDKYFWIDNGPCQDCESHLIHRRGIYKDSFGATQPWADYQFRCNFLIALTVAPEMTDLHRAWTAIKMAENILLGPLGIKTLDPADWNYNGYYHNDDNSLDPKVAHGFNYHQGPEWLWPVGFFCRAKLHFAKLHGPEELKTALSETRSYLGRFYKHIVTSHWRGLPELTNTNGDYCSDGCRVQAWSMASILEVLYEMNQIDISES